ncbi:MAG: caa(3)-type oxidase subunit IV [Deltaproteobacteria bacterium]|nr:caa(3)-type oxidase subunit IV [Deltaproteobacteria bacterium]
MSKESHAHAPHPSYLKIWIILVILLGVSLLGPFTGILWFVLFLAFGVAVAKALMVAAWFMHLNVEKKIVWYVLLACLGLMTFFYFAIAPDIQNTSGTNWRFIDAARH